MEDIPFSFSDQEYERRLKEQTLISRDFVDTAFADWLEDTDDYLCPFPKHMRDELIQRTLRLFLEWTFHLKDLDALCSELLSEKFAEIIEKIGLSLAKTKEEELSILFPSLPRIGDGVTFRSSDGQVEGNGKVSHRRLVMNGESQEIKVTVLLDTGKEYETGFEINSA